MKLLIEIIISIIFHPVAVVLAWVSILGRSDLGTGKKALWMLVTIVWGIGPILYVLVGGGELW